MSEPPESSREESLAAQDVPYISTGVTIRARHHGHCAGCGRPYPVGEVIHHPRGEDGWLAVECCVRT